MQARLIILIVAAGGLAVFFAVRTSSTADEPPEMQGILSAKELEQIRSKSIMLQDLELKCEEPAGPADLSIRVEVDPTDNKDRLYYYITEANGFFVETLDVTFYYKPTPDTTPEASPFAFNQFLNQYVAANDTLRGCIEVVGRELRDAGGQIGRSENWAAEVLGYHRACTSNPDPMPAQRVMQCGD
jgi:hypothetical protein